MKNPTKINNLSSIEELSDEQAMNIFGGREITPIFRLTAPSIDIPNASNPFDFPFPFPFPFPPEPGAIIVLDPKAQIRVSAG